MITLVAEDSSLIMSKIMSPKIFPAGWLLCSFFVALSRANAAELNAVDRLSVNGGSIFKSTVTIVGTSANANLLELANPAGNYRMVVTTSGAVGIGTVTPAAGLHVLASTSQPSALVVSTGTDTGSYVLLVSTWGKIYQSGMQVLDTSAPDGFTLMMINGRLRVADWIEQNVLTDAFQAAVGNSLPKFNMVDGTIDDFTDQTGVDTAASTNKSYSATGHYYSPSGNATDVFQNGSVVWWKLNESNSTDGAVDYSGNNRNFALQSGGAVPVYTTNPPRIWTSSRGPYTSTNMFYTSDAGIYNACKWTSSTDKFTIFARVRIPSGGGGFLVGTYHDGGGNPNAGYRFIANPGGTISYAWNAWYSVDSAALIPLDTWTDICVVGDNTTQEMTFYMNGAFDVKRAGLGVPSGVGVLQLGCYMHAGNWQTPFNGYVSDLAMWNRKLTDAEVASLSSIVAQSMTLISTFTVAAAAPDSARIVLFEQDVDAISLNSDLLAFVTRNNGGSWAQITLQEESNYQPGKRLLSGTGDLSSQTSGTSVRWKVTTHNNKNMKLYGVGMTWD